MKLICFAFFILTISLYAQQELPHSFYELKQSFTEGVASEAPGRSSLTSVEIQSGKKNSGLAILYSLLLPGMGELYAESYNSGIYFTIAEGVLWGTYIGMDTYANWQKNRYESYAISGAGINPDGKDKDFYSRISLYSNIDQYNNEKALERKFDEMYDPQQYFWKWNSTEERRMYREMWLSSEQTFNDIRFVIGAMLLNRLASAVNAVRMVSKYNSRLEEQSWNVSIGTFSHPNIPASLTLNFSTSF